MTSLLAATSNEPMLTEVEALLAEAMRREFPNVADYEVRIFATNGWTAADYEAIDRLADWAEMNGRLGWMFGRRSSAGALRLQWESLVRQSTLPAAEAHAWLAVLAGAPGADAYRLGGPRAVADGPTGLGLLGPLAYAAGLTLAEVRAGYASGRLDVEGLLTLAGLRGWVLPPLP